MAPKDRETLTGPRRAPALHGIRQRRPWRWSRRQPKGRRRNSARSISVVVRDSWSSKVYQSAAIAALRALRFAGFPIEPKPHQRQGDRAACPLQRGLMMAEKNLPKEEIAKE